MVRENGSGPVKRVIRKGQARSSTGSNNVPEPLDDEKENNPRPKTARQLSNVGKAKVVNDKRISGIGKLPSFIKHEEGTGTLTKKRPSQRVRRKSTAETKRKPKHDFAFLNRVKLEQVLGVSATSNNSLSYDPNTENILYTAGCVCVLYNIKKSKQTHIKNVSKKPLTCAAFSPDGAYVVTGESGHQPCVRIWEAATGVQLKELRGHRFGISSVSFSPNSKVVVSVGFTHDSNVSVWNWKTGKQVAGNKVSSRVFGMSFNEKGTYFVTVGIRFVKFWYFNTNDEKALNQLSPCENRAAILENHRNTTFKSVICGKGQFSHLTFCLSNEGSLYSFGESRRVERWLDLKVNDAFALYVTEEHLLCGCSDGVVRVFEPSSLTHIVNLPKPHPLGVDLISCTSPSCMVSVLPNSDFPDCIGVVADSLTSKVIVLYRDKSLYIWDIANIHRVGKYRSYLFHSACVCAIEVYPQETEQIQMCLPKGTFITGSSDNTIKIWNLNTLDPEEQMKTKRNIYSKELMTQIYTDKDFSWLRARRGNAVSDNTSGITALAISPHGDIVASGDKSGNLRVHDLVDLSGNCLAKIEGHDAEILALSFTKPDSYWYYLVSASRDRLMHVFDIRSDYELVQTISDHSAIVTSVKFVEKPNDSQLTLLSCSADKSVRFRTGFKSGSHQLQFQTYQHVQEKSTFNDMEIPQSRDRVVTGCQDRQIRTYELSSGKLMSSFKSGSSEDSGMIVNVALDPSSTYLAAAGSDKCIFLHDLQSGDRLASLYGHSEMITGLKFTNDCKRLISISGDGCIFVWRLSNEVVKNIRTKMRGQGYEPEISADTPNPNRKGETQQTSPHSEYVLPIMDLLATGKQDSLESEHSLADSSVAGQSTPEKKRKQWSKPANLNFLDNLTPSDAQTPCTPLACNNETSPSQTRTAPDGGENVTPEMVKVEKQPSKEPGGGESEEEEDVSAEEESENQIIYAPDKVFSPNTKKRLSSCFDVNVTPQKPRASSDNEEEEDEDDEDNTFQEGLDDIEEEQVKSDSFLKHKFSEIEEEFDDLNLDLPEETLSPNSRHRQSMSRRFYKSSSPDNTQPSYPLADTPRSKGSSPAKSPLGSPSSDRVRQTIEEKIEAKKKEKFALNSELLQHAQITEQPADNPRNTHTRATRDEHAHIRATRGEEAADRKTSVSSTDNTDSTVYKSAESASCEDFVIHRRPSMKSVKSLKMDRLDDNRGSGSSYERRSDSDSVFTKDMTNTKPTNNKSVKDDKKSAGKVKSKSKLKLAFSGGKTKEEKREMKEMKKEEKHEKAAKKSKKDAAVAKKDAGDAKKESPDALALLQSSFKESLLKYDAMLSEEPSSTRDAQLSKLNTVYREMLADIQTRLGANLGNMASAGSGTGEQVGATSAEHHAAKCAELCADKILELVQQRLQDGNLV